MSRAFYRIDYAFLLSLSSDDTDMIANYFHISYDGTYYIDRQIWTEVKQKVKADKKHIRRDLRYMIKDELDKHPDGFSFQVM